MAHGLRCSLLLFRSFWLPPEHRGKPVPGGKWAPYDPRGRRSNTFSSQPRQRGALPMAAFWLLSLQHYSLSSVSPTDWKAITPSNKGTKAIFPYLCFYVKRKFPQGKIFRDSFFWWTLSGLLLYFGSLTAWQRAHLSQTQKCHFFQIFSEKKDWRIFRSFFEFLYCFIICSYADRSRRAGLISGSRLFFNECLINGPMNKPTNIREDKESKSYPPDIHDGTGFKLAEWVNRTSVPRRK